MGPSITVSAFRWVPPFAQGLARDFRVRWALEEAGLPYEERLIGPEEETTESYRALQPFGQIPAIEDDGLVLFVFAAIFWAAFEQAPTSLQLFANDFTDRSIFGWEMPATWFQAIRSWCRETSIPYRSPSRRSPRRYDRYWNHTHAATPTTATSAPPSTHGHRRLSPLVGAMADQGGRSSSARNGAPRPKRDGAPRVRPGPPAGARARSWCSRTPPPARRRRRP